MTVTRHMFLTCIHVHALLLHARDINVNGAWGSSCFERIRTHFSGRSEPMELEASFKRAASECYEQ